MANTTWKQVVLDTADAYREANGTTDKIPVGQLADKVRAGAGIPYEGDNPLTIGQAGFTFPAKTLLKDGLQIINGVNGEDLTDTAADQTTAVTELMKMVNRKIAMNNGEGQYVWKKLTAEGGEFIDYVVSADTEAYPDGGTQNGYWYELVEESSNFATNVWSKEILVQPEISLTNPTITVYTYGRTSPFSHQIYCDAVDFTTMTDSQILSFINGFKNSSYSISVSGSSVTYKSSMQGSSLTSLRRDEAHYISFSGTNQISEYAQTMTYSGKKIIQSLVTEQIGFVVDNDNTAYPNKTVHADGFYYQLLAHIDSANVMRLSNGAYSEVETDVVNNITNEVSGVSY